MRTVAWAVAELKDLEWQRYQLFLAERRVNATPVGNLEVRSQVVHTWHHLADALTEAGVYTAPANWSQPKCQQLTPEYEQAILEARTQGLLD